MDAHRRRNHPQTARIITHPHAIDSPRLPGHDAAPSLPRPRPGPVGNGIKHGSAAPAVVRNTAGPISRRPRDPHSAYRCCCCPSAARGDCGCTPPARDEGSPRPPLRLLRLCDDLPVASLQSVHGRRPQTSQPGLSAAGAESKTASGRPTNSERHAVARPPTWPRCRPSSSIYLKRSPRPGRADAERS